MDQGARLDVSWNPCGSEILAKFRRNSCEIMVDSDEFRWNSKKIWWKSGELMVNRANKQETRNKTTQLYSHIHASVHPCIHVSLFTRIFLCVSVSTVTFQKIMFVFAAWTLAIWNLRQYGQISNIFAFRIWDAQFEILRFEIMKTDRTDLSAAPCLYVCVSVSCLLAPARFNMLHSAPHRVRTLLHPVAH